METRENNLSGNMASLAAQVWKKAQVVYLSPSFDGFPEPRAWVERFAGHPEEENSLIDLIGSSNQLVIAYALLALLEMKSDRLVDVAESCYDRKDGLTLQEGSFSTKLDLGAFARRIARELP